MVTWRRTTKSGLIINLLEQEARYRLFKVVIKRWYELYIRASYFISFNKYTNTQVINLLQLSVTANDDKIIIFLMFVAHLQVIILKRSQTANDSVRYSSRSALPWFLTPIITRISFAWHRLRVEF